MSRSHMSPPVKRTAQLQNPGFARTPPCRAAAARSMVACTMLRAVSLLIVTAGYATLRYNVFKGVPWVQWPVYVVNKSLGLTALGLLVWLLAMQRRGGGRPTPASSGVASALVGCMLAHVFVSLAILTRAYYPKYFAGDTFTLAAGFSWLLGGAATAGLFLRLRRCAAGVPGDALVLGAWGAGVGIHAAVLGFSGWFQPWSWPGYMVPITLISALMGAAALILGLATPRPMPPRGEPARIPEPELLESSR